MSSSPIWDDEMVTLLRRSMMRCDPAVLRRQSTSSVPIVLQNRIQAIVAARPCPQAPDSSGCCMGSRRFVAVRADAECGPEEMFRGASSGKHDSDIQMARRSRSRTTYGSNVTASWQHEVPEARVDAQDHQRALDVHVEERVIHHAYVRIQILFYIFAAYWKEGCHITRPSTTHQHGRSRVEGMSAAHSSILPNVSDNFFDLLKEKLKTSGLNPILEGKLLALGISQIRIDTVKGGDINDETIEYLLAEIPKQERDRMFANHSSLYESMNSTVELPESVNEYDTIIEQRRAMRERAIALLNRVSRGEMDPYDATEQFVSEMHDFFKESQTEVERKQEHLRSFSKTQNRLKELEGLALKGEVDKTLWIQLYLNTFSELQNQSNRISNLNRYSPKIVLDQDPSDHQEILDYILKQKHKNLEYVKTIDRKNHLKSYLEDLIPRLKKSGFCTQDQLELLYSCRPLNNFRVIRTRILTFWEQIDEIQLILHQPSQTEKFFNFIQDQIQQMKPWTPISIESRINTLDETLNIIDWQSKGTATPGLLELLSSNSASTAECSLDDKYDHLKSFIIRRSN